MAKSGSCSGSAEGTCGKSSEDHRREKPIPDELTIESRELQDEIYDCRCKNPLIFDWIYDRLKRDHEVQMNIGAEALVAEAKAAGF